MNNITCRSSAVLPLKFSSKVNARYSGFTIYFPESLCTVSPGAPCRKIDVFLLRRLPISTDALVILGGASSFDGYYSSQTLFEFD